MKPGRGERGKPGEGVSSSTHSLGPGTVAEEEEEKEGEEDSQGEQEGWGGTTEKNTKGRPEMREQKTIPSDDQPPERKMKSPQLIGEADINPKGCRGAWKASCPTYSFYL